MINLLIYLAGMCASLSVIALFGVIPLRNTGSTIVFLFTFIFSLILAAVYIGEKTNERINNVS